MILKLGLEKKKNIGYNILSSLQIWFIGRTLASQAGKAGSTPVICLFEISLKVRESQYLSAFPHFSLFPNRKCFYLKMQHISEICNTKCNTKSNSCNLRFTKKSGEHFTLRFSSFQHISYSL